MIVIFIPGLLCTDKIWGQMNAIRDQYICHDADVISFSSIEEMAENIDKHTSADDVAIIGISMGGYVAIDAAIKMGSRVKKLVLIGTTANSVNEDTIPDREKCIELAKVGKLKEITNISRGICFFSPREEWLTLEEVMANEVGCDAYIRQQRAIMSRKNYSDALKNIKADTLVIAGKNDAVIPCEHAVFMSKLIPNSKLILIDDCGHLPTIEKGSMLADLVPRFLGS